MTAYDETRCYAPVGGADHLYCGSPAKRFGFNGRPLCGRCKDPAADDMPWGPSRHYPEGLSDDWEFRRNPPPLTPLKATVGNVVRVLTDARISMHDTATGTAGLHVRKSYGGGVAIDYRHRDGQWVPDNEMAGAFAVARWALAARGLTLVMVDDRHATVTETKP